MLGTCLLLFLLIFSVATDALFMKGLFQIESGLRAMATEATDVLSPFLEFTFIQDVFPIFIDVMAVLAR